MSRRWPRALWLLAGPVLALRSIPAINLSPRTVKSTNTLAGSFQKIYYQLLTLSTSFQEHGTDSIYCYLFFFFATNIISFPKIYNFCTRIQKKCKIKTSVLWVCLHLSLVTHHKWSLSLLPCQRRKLPWVACCESDNAVSSVAGLLLLSLFPSAHPPVA